MMIDILFLLIIAFLGFMVWRIQKGGSVPFLKGTNESKTQSGSPEEQKKSLDKKLIRSLLGIEDIRLGMLHLPKNTYVMALKCDPVNYHLRNPLEQEGIDVRFEQWLTSIEYPDPVVWHLQSRYLDLKQQKDDYIRLIEEDQYHNEATKNYSYMIIRYLEEWLNAMPRYEIVRYVLFPFKLTDPKPDKAQNEERALRELYRRASSASNFLEGCGVKSQICTTEDLAEMVYYSLNRKRAAKARFQDVKLQEMLALFCTSEQDEIRIKKVLGENFMKPKEVEVNEENTPKEVYA